MNSAATSLAAESAGRTMCPTERRLQPSHPSPSPARAGFFFQDPACRRTTSHAGAPWPMAGAFTSKRLYEPRRAEETLSVGALNF
jgi:hypothetical protein